MNYRGSVRIRDETERMETFGQLQHLGELLQLEPLVAKSESKGRFDEGDAGSSRAPLSQTKTVIIGTVLIHALIHPIGISAPRYPGAGRGSQRISKFR